MHWIFHREGGPRRVNHAAAVVGDTIYSFGGYCTAQIHCYRQRLPIDVHMLNTYTVEWRALDRPSKECKQFKVTPYQRYGHTVVAYGSQIYLWGGRNDMSACSVLYCFDTETFLWSCPKVTGTIPSPRDGHSACVIGNMMYIFGGYEEDLERYSQELWAFNFSNNSWNYVMPHGEPPMYRDFHTATAVGKCMYVFGGRSDEQSAYSTDYEYYPRSITYFDTVRGAWCHPKTTGRAPVGRRSHSAFTFEGKLYIFGGYNGIQKEHYNDIYMFCPTTCHWSQVNTIGSVPTARRRQACIVVGHRMFLFGGTSPMGPPVRCTMLNNEDIEMDDLVDHDDLHVLDLSPSLKTLSLLTIRKHNLTDPTIPEDLKWDVKLFANNHVIESPRNPYFLR